MEKKLFSKRLCLLLLMFTLTAYTTIAQQKENRDVTGFTGIALSISADIYLSQANSFSVVIEGKAEVLKDIETIVEGNVLKIKRKNNLDWNWRDEDVKLYISMPQVEKISISGSGDIVAQTPISTNSLTMKISGSGDIKMDELTVSTLEIGISGSGDIDLAGKQVAESASYAISGSGDIDTEGLQCKKVEISVSGSGDVRVWAVDELNAKISGSGDVYYKGRPLINAKSSGSGEFHSIVQ